MYNLYSYYYHNLIPIPTTKGLWANQELAMVLVHVGISTSSCEWLEIYHSLYGCCLQVVVSLSQMSAVELARDIFSCYQGPLTEVVKLLNRYEKNCCI